MDRLTGVRQMDSLHEGPSVTAFTEASTAGSPVHIQSKGELFFRFSAGICIIRHNFTHVRLRQDPWRDADCQGFVTDLLFLDRMSSKK